MASYNNTINIIPYNEDEIDKSIKWSDLQVRFERLGHEFASFRGPDGKIYHTACLPNCNPNTNPNAKIDRDYIVGLDLREVLEKYINMARKRHNPKATNIQIIK